MNALLVRGKYVISKAQGSDFKEGGGGAGDCS